MIYLKNQLANFELYVAKYYMRRQAYVASLSRAKFIVESYQKTPAVSDALAIMAEAYKNLNESRLEESTKIILEKKEFLLTNIPYRECQQN